MTMDDKDRLPDDLLFEADGHVTEVALACLADGEIALLDAEAVAHVDRCDTCTARLGASALRSLVATEALSAVGAAASSEARALVVTSPTALSRPASSRPASSRPSTMGASPVHPGGLASEPWTPRLGRSRRPLPVLAIAAALVLATAAGAPGFFETAAALPRQLPSVQILVRVFVVLARSTPEGLFPAAVLLRWASAAVLIVVGSVVALSMTRRGSLQEEGGVG